MPVFGEPNFTDSPVVVGSTGATGTVTYTASPGDFVIAEPDVEPIVIVLPAISNLFPKVAVQPSPAAIASGPPYYPTAPQVSQPVVSVAQIAASGAGAVSFHLSSAEVTAGVKLVGATGPLALPAGPSSAGVSVVAYNGNWYQLP